MRDFQNRNFKRRLVYSWPVAAAVFLLAVFLGQAAVRSYLVARNTKSAYTEARKDREDLEAKRVELDKTLDYLSTPYGLERELRRKFGLAKPGEHLIVIVDRTEEIEPEEKNGFSSLVSEVGNFLGGIFKIGQ